MGDQLKEVSGSGSAKNVKKAVKPENKKKEENKNASSNNTPNINVPANFVVNMPSYYTTYYTAAQDKTRVYNPAQYMAEHMPVKEFKETEESKKFVEEFFKNIEERRNNPATKFGMNIGITILEPKATKTKLTRELSSVFTYPLRWGFRNVDRSLIIPEDEMGVTDLPRQFVMFERAVKLRPKENNEQIFSDVLNKTEHTVGVNIDYIMGYMQLYDGWDYVPFPKTFCDACYKNGSVPVITLEPYFKRHYVELKNGKLVVQDFLEEYNEQISDHKSKLYEGLKKIADETAEWAYGREVDFRIFHEANLDFGYPWTMYMNGEANAPEKYKLAWENTYKIFAESWETKYGKEAKKDFKFIWCPIAYPNTDENPVLGFTWNNFGNFFPDKGVDEIGFDIYQEKREKSFNTMFNDAGTFINNIRKQYPNMPVSICEASTKPEDYRTEFITQLFGAATKYGFKYVSWFNEDKEFNWSIGATITTWTSEKTIDKAREASNVDIMAAIYGIATAPTNAPKKEIKETSSVEDINESLKTLREMALKYTSSEIVGITVNENASNNTPPDTYYQKLFGLESPATSYGSAITQWVRIYSRNLLKMDLGSAAGLNKISALKDDPATRLALAKEYAKMWYALPKKYVYCEARKTVGTTEYKVTKIKQNNNGDDYAVYKSGMQEPIVVKKLSEIKNNAISEKDMAVFKELWEEAKYYKGETNAKGEVQITDLQMAFKLLDKTINDKKLYGTKEYIMSLIAKQEYLLKYDAIYSDEAEKIQKGAVSESMTFDAAKEAEKICLEILDIFNSKVYLKYGYNNPQLSQEWVLGLRAQIDVSLGDIYASESIKKYDKAETYYKQALDDVKEKEKYRYPSEIKEKFLNNSAEIGLARVQGLIAASKGDLKTLDACVYTLAQKVQLFDLPFSSKGKELDPGLVIKAKFDLAELLAGYTQFIGKGLSKEEGLKRLRVSYTIFQELLSSELSYRAGVKMDGTDKHGGIKKVDGTYRKME
jgi:hypothetical protein